MRIIITTTQSAAGNNLPMGEFIRETGYEFIPRNRRGLDLLRHENQADGVIVWQSDGPILYIDGQKFYFHPSMAKNRLSFFRKTGAGDPLYQACKFAREDSFLDCTVGLGADAIVASYLCSPGRVIGLESSPLIAAVVKWGMRFYETRINWLADAIKHIQIINQEHLLYLKQMESGSFDIVYFDPMFRHPVLKSTAIAPLRLIADHRPLQKEVIEEACRVSRKRVVVKEHPSSGEFERLGINRIVGNPRNPIAYGVIEV